jgi:MFS family permease
MEKPLRDSQLSKKTRFFTKLDRWNKIFAHSFLFGLQAVAFGMPNAIFKTIFFEIGIITPDQEKETPKYVGILACFFFVGKTFSDPLWGFVRDKYGDKKSILAVAISLTVSSILFGLSKNFFILNLTGVLVGLSSGICTPGYSFMNWIEEDQRTTLSMIINLFNGAGALAGPLVGSYLVTIFQTNKILYTWSLMAGFICLSTVYFLLSFRDFNDRLLIGKASEGEVLDMKQM